MNASTLRPDGITREIHLKGGLVALIDDTDWPLVRQYHWYPKRATLTTYVRANVRGDRRMGLYLHRLILNAPDGVLIDHENCDGLDNRRAKLRVCTHHENQRNKLKRPGGTSKYKGVFLQSGTGSWVARIKHHKKQYQLGSFQSEKEAALTYDYYARLLFGEFAQPNFDGEHFNFSDICSRALKKKKRTTSRFWGVSQANGSFHAVFRGKSLGYSTDEIAMAKAYDEAAFERYGIFAKLNFPANFGFT